MANQGIYHPTYNPNGSKKLSDDNFWYNTSVSINSTMDCFDSSKMLAASGNIGTTSGRPDGTFYDQIVENSILDLRNSSKKVEDYNRLIGREFNKLVTGTNRGKEGEWGYALTFKDTIASIGVGFLNVGTTAISLNNIFGDGYVNKLPVLNRVIVENVTRGLTVPIEYYGVYNRMYIPSFSSLSTWAAGDTINIYIARQTTRTKSNTLLHCDIIGNPTNYPTAWKESGVFGTPLIVAEDGTSLLPNGTLDSFKLSRKANATPLLCLRSTDSGATWTSFTPTFSTTTNAITLTDEPATNLVMVYYQTKTSMAIPAVNNEVLELGEVFACNGHPHSYLLNTLIGKSGVATGILASQFLGKISGYSFTTDAINSTSIYAPNNTPITLGASNPAVKVFPYLKRLNGKAYLNLMYKEMKYGSYLAPTVVTAASATYTQNMTYKINIAGSALDGKVIKWVGATTTSAIDWSLYDVSPTGVIYLLSSGVVYNNAKLYDGDSWGDDGKFNIVDKVSTTLDDNGQTVLIGQKTVELPYFIAGDE